MEEGRVVACGHRLGSAQPGIDVLIGRDQQGLELVELGFGQAVEFRRREGAENQVDFLEAASLRPEQ